MPNADLRIVADWSFAGRFYITDLASPRGLISKGNPFNAGGEYALVVGTDGIPDFTVRKADDSGFVTVSGPVITPGQWFHVIVYHDSVKDVIGIRIELSTSKLAKITGGVFQGTNTFRIGSLAGINFHKGRATLCAMWSRLLTPIYETDFLGANTDHTLWGQIGDDGADLLTNCTEIWPLNVSGDAEGAHSGNDLEANGTPGTSSAGIVVTSPPDYDVALDSAGLEDGLLVDITDTKVSRTESIFTGLNGLALHMLEAAPPDRITVGPITIGTVCSFTWWMKNVSGASVMVCGESNGFGAIYFDGGIWVLRDSALNNANVPYVIPFLAWHHYAVVRNGATVQFFVDGVQVSTDQTIAGSVGWDISYLVGPSFGIGVGAIGEGFVDDQRIYEGDVLTSAQLLELFAGEFEATGAAYTYRWGYDEGS